MFALCTKELGLNCIYTILDIKGAFHWHKLWSWSVTLRYETWKANHCKSKSHSNYYTIDLTSRCIVCRPCEHVTRMGLDTIPDPPFKASLKQWCSKLQIQRSPLPIYTSPQAPNLSMLLLSLCQYREDKPSNCLSSLINTSTNKHNPHHCSH